MRNKLIIYLTICFICGMFMTGCNVLFPTQTKAKQTEICKKQYWYDDKGNVVGYYYQKEFFCKLPE